MNGPIMGNIESLSVLSTFIICLIIVFPLIPYSLYKRDNEYAKLPLINGKRPGEFTYANSKKRFLTDAQSLIRLGFTQGKSAFRLVTDLGEKIILSPQYADFIRSDDRLSMNQFVARESLSHIPGFEPFKAGSLDELIIQDVLRVKLTRSLSKVTKTLTEETDLTLSELWTDNSEWHEITAKSDVLKIIARLSSCIFLGPELCRDPAWLQISVDYAVHAFVALQSLRLWPSALRPIVHWLLPSCRKLRSQLNEARSVLWPIIIQRRKAKNFPGEISDAVEWMEEVASGRKYDPAVSQLTLSLTAIHTTGDLLTQVIFDLCEHQELIAPLREEMITVLQKDGWQQSALHKLKLLDSVIKESQRLKPTAIVSMRRYILEDIRLPDGTILPKNHIVFVSSDLMWDPTMYPNPEIFDGYRFLKLREKSYDQGGSMAHLVSTGPDHMGFGHGKHACPGRFFAVAEVKIALCHMLLKYDWKLQSEINKETKPAVYRKGISLLANPTTKILIRRRQEEIDLGELRKE